MIDADLPLPELRRALECGPEGLASAEAARRLRAHGPNAPSTSRARPALALLVALLGNPLVVILLLAAGVSGAIGETVGAAIIAVMVLLSVGLNFALSYRSQRAAERLRAEVAPTARVRRDGQWRDLARRELVPGDLVQLIAGDHVPADARLVVARDLHVQQAALTGESEPVEKEPAERPAPGTEPAAARHRVFLGTSVVAGDAEAIVVATGDDTVFGDIAARLSERPPPTEFERGLDAFARLILKTVVFLLLFVLLAGIATGRPPMESLLFALALAVGLTPEFMPMITTVTLARGAERMARRQVVVRHLAAIEDFGSMDLLLSDKTGTLTAGALSVEASLDPFGARTPDALRLAALNSRHDTGIRSALDDALVAAKVEGVPDWRKLDEIPFDFERRRVSIVLERASDALLVAKGAPEQMLADCTRHAVDAIERPLDATARARCAATFDALGDAGLRVLAVATRALPLRARYGADDERDLTLVGFVAFADPPLPDAADALRALEADGLGVKIVTGDNERVAAHVCAKVGLDTRRVVLGRELDALSDAALGAVAEAHTVFARVSPAQKQRLVLVLKARGHVVGFLGDGINDAPALHAADVGISVANAVDVAKDAADIILRERSLRVLHRGVLEGRRAFANVMKYLFMGTSSNFGNMFSMAVASLFLPFLPMLPTQILLNNFLYDLAQVTIPSDRVDASMVRRPQRWNVRLIRDFMLRVGPISSLFDALTFAVLLGMLSASPARFQTGWFVESLATQTLVLFVIRTAGNPLRSRPSAPLAWTIVAVVATAIALPNLPVGARFGFEPLPAAFWVFLVAATAAYLALVDRVKRRVLGRDAG